MPLGYHRRGAATCKGIKDDPAFRTTRLYEKLREPLWHDGSVLPSRAVVLIVGLGNRHHVSGVGASLPVGLGSVSAETGGGITCLLYTSPSPRDRTRSRMPSS